MFKQHKDIYIPFETISLSDGTINKWYVISWFKHKFILGVKDEHLDETKAKSFLFVTALN
ncbi:hypothetical protein QP385_05485 [Lactobacillus iners]|uniref:hypothetical protein n=1 Tax=Lactobacillus iners TaxID=147802 RepID=UPI00254ABCBD|nr:hypothetical protein [Lactobacillus iners]MDK7109012.1 hypothetical protein [Lactobacillus iners]